MNKRERISELLEALEFGPADANAPDHYAAFFRLWNEQRYYDAHDVLEQLWLAEEDPAEARFYQGLIQAAGAFVHLQKNFEHPAHAKHSRRLRPATRLFALAIKNLEHLPDQFGGLDLAALRQLLHRYRDQIITEDYARNPWSPTTAPRISPGH